MSRDDDASKERIGRPEMCYCDTRSMECLSSHLYVAVRIVTLR